MLPSARAEPASYADRADEWLVERCRESAEDDAFAELVRRYRGPVFRLAVSILGQAFAPVPEFGVWGLHIYVGRHNPSGTFAPWNPKVSCANAGAQAAAGHAHGR